MQLPQLILWATALTLGTRPGSLSAHEYLHVPPARTDSCLLNGVIMGTTICDTITPGGPWRRHPSPPCSRRETQHG